MTLAPSRELGTRLTIPEQTGWIEYEYGEVCCVPGCRKLGQRGFHHIEPRSRTAGPKDYVAIDGCVRSNKCKVCDEHHLAVTGGIGGHKARIVWFAGQWYWEELWRETPAFDANEWRMAGPLEGGWNVA